MSEIEIRNLTKTFDIKGRTVHALKNISLSIGQGDIFGIIGMSGAGKSTLVRSINYLEKPTEGQVLIDGVDLADLTEKQLRKKRSDIGMIFQNFNLLEQKNVLDNICFPLEIAGVKKKEARKRAKELLKTVNCPVDRSSVSLSRVHWLPIRRFCCVMRQRAHLIHRRQPQS